MVLRSFLKECAEVLVCHKETDCSGHYPLEARFGAERGLVLGGNRQAKWTSVRAEIGTDVPERISFRRDAEIERFHAPPVSM